MQPFGHDYELLNEQACHALRLQQQGDMSTPRPGASDWQGPPTQLTSASSFVPEEYLQLLCPEELKIVVDVVQKVLDGTLPKSAIAEVRRWLKTF